MESFTLLSSLLVALLLTRTALAQPGPSSSTVPTTTITIIQSPSTASQSTPDPSLCTQTASNACLSAFIFLFGIKSSNSSSSNDTTPVSTTAAPKPMTISHCDQPTVNDTGRDTCLTVLPASNCSILNTPPQIGNKTNFGFMCASDGSLEMVSYSTKLCSQSFLNLINDSMTVLCGIRNVKNPLNCSLDSSNNLIATNASLLGGLKAAKGCVPSTTPIPLLPNPVGPAAITAIVVMVCLAIVAILATFFFWPKCHIPDAALLPKKQPRDEIEGIENVTMKADKGETGYATGGARTVQYDARGQAVNLSRMPPTLGPSAA